MIYGYTKICSNLKCYDLKKMRIILTPSKSGTKPSRQYHQISLHMKYFKLSSTNHQMMKWLQVTSRVI